MSNIWRQAGMMGALVKDSAGVVLRNFHAMAEVVSAHKFPSKSEGYSCLCRFPEV